MLSICYLVSQVRELAIHILWNLELMVADTESLKVQMLETAYLAESMPASIGEYREKLKHMQKLSCVNPSVQEAVTRGVVDGKIFLRLLLGSLYINFKLIWEPVSSHIIDYSRCVMVSEFWPIFHDFFINVVECIQKETKIGTSLSNFQGNHIIDSFAKSFIG